jgi:hypothetical protein
MSVLTSAQIIILLPHTPQNRTNPIILTPSTSIPNPRILTPHTLLFIARSSPVHSSLAPQTRTQPIPPFSIPIPLPRTLPIPLHRCRYPSIPLPPRQPPQSSKCNPNSILMPPHNQILQSRPFKLYLNPRIPTLIPSAHERSARCRRTRLVDRGLPLEPEFLLRA